MFKDKKDTINFGRMAALMADSSESAKADFEGCVNHFEQAVESKAKTLAGGAAHDQLSPEEATLYKQNAQVAGALMAFFSAEEVGKGANSNYVRARQAATGSKVESGTEIHVNFSEGFRGFRDKSETVLRSASDESFAYRSIGKVQQSVFEYNLRAAVQDEYNKAFWRLRMINPGEVGVTYEVPILTVRREQRYGATNNATTTMYDRQRNVWDAVQDTTILEGDYLKLVPVKPDTGAYAAYFAAYDNSDEKVMGVDVVSAPLLAKDSGGNSARLNYLDLARSNAPGLISAMEGIDAISTGARLEALYFNGQVSGTDYTFRLPTLGMNRSSFNDSAEGGKEVYLNFRENEIKLMVAGIKNKFGGSDADVPAFVNAALDGAEVAITVEATGTLNLESGEIIPPSVNIARVTRIVLPEAVAGQGPQVFTAANINDSAAEVQAAWSLLTAMFTTSNYHAYKIDASATNSSQRENGNIIDSRTVKYRAYVIPRTPLTILSEATGNSDYETVSPATAASCARIRRNNDGVLKMFEISDQYQMTIGSLSESSRGGMRPAVGISSALVKPYYFRDAFDVQEAYTSVQSANREFDVAGAIVTYLKSVATTMIRDSHYSSTLEYINPGEKPRIIIGTDVKTAAYIFRHGDSRLFGEDIEVKVVTTDVAGHYGRIMMSLARENRGDGDLLSSGECIVAPDYVANLAPVTDGASQPSAHQKVTIRPAYAFVPVLPCLCDISLSNLDTALASSSVFQTSDV